MADAEDSKSFARKGVRVQIPLRARNGRQLKQGPTVSIPLSSGRVRRSRTRSLRGAACWRSHSPARARSVPGTGTSWTDHPSWEVVDEANALSGRDITHLLTTRTMPSCGRPSNAQLATFVLSLVALDAIERVGSRPTVCAGHSLGEYSALAQRRHDVRGRGAGSSPSAARRWPMRPNRIQGRWPQS